MTTLEDERPRAPAYDTIDALPAEYVWKDRVPVGELAILAGPGGAGKGCITCDLAARISAGRPMPGSETADRPRHVLMASGEDHPNVVVRPRLEAAGADMAFVHDLTEIDGEQFCLADPAHIARLYAEVARLGDVALVILDPLTALAGVTIASVYRVRQIMTPLQRFCRMTGVSVLLTHHLTKDGKVAGSQAVKDSVRCVLKIEPDDDPEVLRIVVDKTNMGIRNPPVQRYRIVSSDEGVPVVDYLAETAKPANGYEAIMAVLADRAGRGELPVAGQAIAAETGIIYSTVRVYCQRLIAEGMVVSPERGMFSPAASNKDEKPQVSEPGAVTTPDTPPVTDAVL